MLPLHQSPRDSSVLDRVNQIVRISGFRCKPGRKGEPALGFGFGPGQRSGMVQILGFSGNSTDRPHASTVEVLSVVGPMAGSGTLVAVKAQYV